VRPDYDGGYTAKTWTGYKAMPKKEIGKCQMKFEAGKYENVKLSKLFDDSGCQLSTWGAMITLMNIGNTIKRLRKNKRGFVEMKKIIILFALSLVLGASSLANAAQLETAANEVIETFSTAIAAVDGQSFGQQGQLTFELDRNGTFVIDGTSGLAWQKSDSYLDSALIRSTSPLSQTYKISVVVGDIDYGLEHLDGLVNDPNYPEGPLNENGFYMLAITDTLPTAPHTNLWWHEHRKVVIDVDNNIWNNGGTNPVFMVYFDLNNNLSSYDGSQDQWIDQWTNAVMYQKNAYYRIEIEKTPQEFIFRAFTEGGQLLKEAKIALNNVWHANGAVYPEYLIIGEPHENYYQGSMKIKEILIYQ